MESKAKDNFCSVFARCNTGRRCSQAVASTKMNDRSSRSHVIVGIHVVQQTERGWTVQHNEKQNFACRLSGSERVGKTSASGQTLKRPRNQSLSALGNCMRALTHLPLSQRRSPCNIRFCRKVGKYLAAKCDTLPRSNLRTC